MSEFEECHEKNDKNIEKIILSGAIKNLIFEKPIKSGV